MIRNGGAACLLFLALLTFVHGVHEPPPGTPAFIRSAVESVPDRYSGRYEQFKTAEFGETKLPLRSAVERIPSVAFTESSQKSFIRSSVESRPGELDDELETSASNVKSTYYQTMTGQYDAYIIPKAYNVENPQPFRSGSPFQRIVDSKVGFQRYLAGIESNNKLRDAEAESKKVLCHITNWSFYRSQPGKFIPELLDAKLCTHILYSFGSLDPTSLTVREFDKWADIENDLYRRTTSLSRDVPVLLSIGGWTDSAGDKYSRLVSDASTRRRFVLSVVPFLKQYGFKGLHFDWNYPKCWQSDCRKGPDSDRPNFTRLIKELSVALRRESLLLGVAVSGYKEVIEKSYDIAELSNDADFITVMTYDYHGAWEGRTGHISPLFGQSDDKYPQYNTNFAMHALVQQGADRSKLIVGIPFYGQSFTLRQPSQGPVGYGVESRGPGKPGEITKQPGMLSYYEICDNIRQKRWEATRAKSGPYASKGDQWVGYEDVESVALKAKYVVDSGFGGIAAWTVDLDDFNNLCCLEPFPLLSSINRAFKRISSPKPYPGNCVKPQEPVTPVAPVMTTVGENGIAAGALEPTTWPSWKPSTTTTQSSTESTSSTAWWQTSPLQSSTWWPSTTTTTTTTTTTRRPYTTTTRRTTTTYFPDDDDDDDDTVEIIPVPTPVNFNPVTNGERCTDGEYKADPSSCSTYFYCVYGKFNLQNCAVGLHWNERGKRCDWPKNSGCQTVQSDELPEMSPSRPSQKPSKRPSKKPTKPSTTVVQSDELPEPSSPKPSRKPSKRPTKPSKPSTTVIQSDESYETTKPSKKPSKRPSTTTTTREPTTERRTTTSTTTTERSTTTTTTLAASQRPPQLASSGACQNGAYYPNLSDCGSYSICNNHVLVPAWCGPGLQWDQANEQCELKSKVRCISSKSYFQFARLADLQLDDPCDEGGGYVPYPGDCERYLICLFGNLREENCPNGLHWNDGEKTCDWPQHANCKATDSDALSEVDDLNEVNPPKPKPTKTTTTTTTTTRKPRPSTPQPDIKPLSGHYKLVCYFTNWAWYRQNRIAKYTPDNIDTRLCTHIVYGFAVLDVTELTIRTHDSWADIDNKFYTRVTDLKQKGVKVSLALGGWNDSQGDKYSRLVRNPASRAKFIRQAIEFIEKYNFDGLDLDWEYPVCWQTECNKGFADEQGAFTAWVRELSVAFKPKGLLLSTAVSPSKQIIDKGYDVAELAKYFDWISIMAYDYHGQWDKITGHVAPMYPHPDDTNPYFNANFSINYWIEKGAPPRKLVMGMPLYGQAFSLTNENKNGLNAPAPQPGQAGEFTRAAGFLAYYEICDRVENRGWTVVQDPQRRMGPYAYKGNQWVSFDDKAMIRQKSEYVRKLGLGGGMVWALDLDDFTGHCGQGVHPLLTELQSVLRDPPKPSDQNLPDAPVEQSPPTTTIAASTSSEPSSTSSNNGQEVTNDDTVEIEADSSAAQTSAISADYKVVCYFTNWAWYRQGGGKYLPEEIDANLCTHIVYGFAVLDRESLTIKPHDTWADFDNHFYERVTAYKKKGVKVTVAIGGWNDSAGDKYSRLVRSVASRARFIRHVIEFIEKHNFDGLDLDWEYPVCWQVDCKQGHADEKQHFAALVRELSTEFKPRGWLLSTAVSPSKTVIDAGYEVKSLSQHFDWISVMAYDYHGQWDKQTGHVAPMYLHPDDVTPYFNTNFTINYWIDQGADPRKLILGMPMYGQSFSLAETKRHGLNQMTYGGGEAGEATRARGFLAYYEICERIRNNKWTVVRDRRGRMGPYAYSKDQWVSFDDVLMIRHKSEFVKAMKLGGAMIWALDLDDFRNVCQCEEYPLLRTINRVLRNYPGPAPVCKLEDEADVTDEIEEAELTTSAPTSSTWWPTQPSTSTSTTTTRPFAENPPEGEEEESEIEPDAANICKTRSQLFYAHGSDCNKYYMCDNGHALLQSCPPGLNWNRDHCDWPINTQCDTSTNEEEGGEVDPSKPSTTRRPTTTTTQRSTTEGPTREPRPTLPPDFIEEDDGSFKVVCYFTNWAWYRPEGGKFLPKDIDPNLCTHIVYGFAVLNGETLTIQSHDSWADIDNHFYEQVTEFKKQGKKVTVAIGGWNDSAGDKYSRLVRSAKNRYRFITDVIQFIKKYNFDGLDLDWEYPVCWQVECHKGKTDEKKYFGVFVQELWEEFNPRGWLLSAAVSPSKMVIDAGYDIPVLAKYFSWIAVMTYDYHGQWDRKTGHVAPLYALPEDQYDYFNSNFTINYWIQQGTPSRKIIMGVPMYGQSFVLSSPSNNGLNAPSYGGGEAGKYTRANGFLAFYEICVKTNVEGWKVTRDSKGRIGPYATKGNQWVSYDDVADVRRKAQFMKQLNLGGGMVWAIDLDDFTNTCGCGQSPLLTTLNQELRNIGGIRAENCT